MDKLLIELHNIRSSGLITEQREDNDTIVKRSLFELGVVLDGTFTFGAGITAFLPIVRDLINGEIPHMDNTTVTLLYIVAIWSITGRHMDKVTELMVLIKERGLKDTLAKVINFLKSLEDVSLKIAGEVGHAASDIADIGAFTFLMFPIMDVVLYLIDSGSITLGEPSGYLKSVLIGIGIVGVKNIFNTIISKLRFRLSSRRMDESKLRLLDDDNISEDVIKVIKSTMFTNNSSSWVLPECVGGSTYSIDGDDYTINLTVSRDVSLTTSTHLVEIRSFGDTINIDVTIDPHKEHVIYRHIKNTIRECVGTFNNSNRVSDLLNESGGTNRVRTIYEDSEIMVVVPLNKETFCELSRGTNWCDTNLDGNNLTLVDRVRKGTPYIHTNKKTGTKHLLHDKNRLPFNALTSSLEPNMVVYDKVGTTVGRRRFLSPNKGLSELFNIKYSMSERIKFDIPLDEEELLKFSETNEFTKAINKVRLNYNEETEAELLEFVNSDKWVVDTETTPRYSKSESKTYVTTKHYGIELSVPINEFKERYLALSDDDARLFDNMDSHNPYVDYYDDDELNYLHSYLDDDSLEIFRTLTKLFGKEIQGELNDSEINDFLHEHYESIWDSVSADILSDIGYGVEEHKNESVKEYFEDESIFPFTISFDDVDFSINWDQLLYIVYVNDIKTFDELDEHDICEMDDLYTIYESAYGMPKRYSDDINKTFTEMIEELSDNFTSTYKENIENYNRIIKDLGFKKQGWGNNYLFLTNMELGKTIYIHNFDPNKDTVWISVVPDNERLGSNNENKHIIGVDDIVNYVQSPELEFEN